MQDSCEIATKGETVASKVCKDYRSFNCADFLDRSVCTSRSLSRNAISRDNLTTHAHCTFPSPVGQTTVLFPTPPLAMQRDASRASDRFAARVITPDRNKSTTRCDNLLQRRAYVAAAINTWDFAKKRSPLTAITTMIDQSAVSRDICIIISGRFY